MQAQLALIQHDYKAAELYATQALKQLEEMGENDSHRKILPKFVIGEVFKGTGKLVKAEPYYKDVYQYVGKLPPAYAIIPPLTACNRLASVTADVGKREEAIQLFRECFGRAQSAALDDPERGIAVGSLVILLAEARKPTEAEKIARDELEKLHEDFPADSPVMARILDALARSIKYQGNRSRLNETIAIQQNVLDIHRKTSGENSLEYAAVEADMSESLIGLNRFEQAEAYALHALSTRKALLGEKHLHTVASGCNLAIIYFFQGRYEEAIPLLRKAHSFSRTSLGTQSGYFHDVQYYLVSSLRKLGKEDEASKIESDAGVWVIRSH